MRLGFRTRSSHASGFVDLALMARHALRGKTRMVLGRTPAIMLTSFRLARTPHPRADIAMSVVEESALIQRNITRS